MTTHDDSPPAAAPGGAVERSDGPMAPLPGELGIPNVAQRRASPMSRKAVVPAVLLIGSIVAVLGLSIHRFVASGKPGDEAGKRPGQRPVAAAAESRRLELPSRPPLSTTAPTDVRIPALEPTAEEAAPIGVRSAQGNGPAAVRPEDAPVMLWSGRGSNAPPTSSRSDGSTLDRPGPSDSGSSSAARTARNLADYQRQAQGLLENLMKRTEGTAGASSALGGGMATGNAVPASPTTAPGLLGGDLPRSATPRAVASPLMSRSLTLPKGTTFTCALKTRIVSASSGFVGCQVLRNLYSDDGRVLLVERGSHLDGEYRATTLKPGSVRIPVLWTRLRTPNGISVDLDSPGTGPLGESGVDGHVDNRWGDRIGAALLLSLIDDAVKITVSNQTGQAPGDTTVLSSTTGTGSDLAEKVLDSTIHIPPLIYQDQGAIVGIYVARDVDFSSVYELVPSQANAITKVAP
jgi:type IV secretion system protein VirB10